MQREALTDEDLMERYRDGDMRAFEELLSRHSRSVYNFIARFFGRRSLSGLSIDDVTQEVFVRIIRGAEAYQRRAKFTTWLYTIARNLCVDTLRRQRHRVTASLDAPLGDDPNGGTLIERVVDEAPLGDRRAMDEQFTHHLRLALDELNEDQREVFILREFQHLPFAEIAAIVDSPINTVKSRMRYALEGLRAALEAAGISPGA